MMTKEGTSLRSDKDSTGRDLRRCGIDHRIDPMDRCTEDADCHDAEDDSWLGTTHQQHNDQPDTLHRLVYNLGPCSCWDRDRCVARDRSSVDDTLHGRDRAGWNKDCLSLSIVSSGAL